MLVFFVRIPAWVYLGGWFLYQLVEGNFGLASASANGGGVAFFAHVGGFAFGALLTLSLLNAGVSCRRASPTPPPRARPDDRRRDATRTHRATGDHDSTIRVARRRPPRSPSSRSPSASGRCGASSILLLLAVTLAAAIRPGVEWLRPAPHRRSRSGSCFTSSSLGGALALFVWLAVPPALHQIVHALGAPPAHATGVRERVLDWLRQHLHQLPTGTQLLHPVATYGQKASEAFVGIFFTVAATWYPVSEHDSFVRLLTALAPESRREQARMTYREIDRRLGSYTRLRFLMVFAVGTVLSAGFYVVGLDYWLLVGAFVGVAEIVPIIGPLFGAILVLAVGLPQSVHVAVLALLWLCAVRLFQDYVVNPHLGWARLGSHRWSRSSPSPSSGSSSAPSPSSSPCPSRRRWERSSTSSCSATTRRPPSLGGRSEPLHQMTAQQPVLFVNPRSGGGKAERAGLAERARERGIDVIVVRSEDDVAALVADAVVRGADVLGIAGGDGSLAIVAASAVAHGLPFVCIPAGTRNHFALDIGVDRRDLVGALDAFTDGIERRIDVAEVNGRLFLNNVSLGIYGDAVRQPAYRDAKARTLLHTAANVLGPSAPATGLAVVDDLGRLHSDPAVVLVSNNAYSPEPPRPPGTRATLAGGRLGVVVLDRRGPVRTRGGRGPRGDSRYTPPHPWTRESTARPSRSSPRSASRSGPARSASGSRAGR